MRLVVAGDVGAARPPQCARLRALGSAAPVELEAFKVLSRLSCRKKSVGAQTTPTDVTECTCSDTSKFKPFLRCLSIGGAHTWPHTVGHTAPRAQRVAPSVVCGRRAARAGGGSSACLGTLIACSA